MERPSSEAPQATATAGRYERVDRIDEGTFFTTYSGRDSATGRPVALHLLKPEYVSDRLFVDRVQEELRRTGSLQHPAIVGVLDVVAEGEGLTVVTELARGIHLKERIRRVAPFPLLVAVQIAAACAEALNSAAEAGIPHGDLRPENVLITQQGQVKVLGFGIAPSLASSARIQLTALPDLAPYLAPERAQGSDPDTASDLYSLGILLYEMLSGVTPFLGETPLAVAVKHLHDPPPSLRQRCPGIPRAVEGVVLKCLQKDPKDRYANAGALLEDLNRIKEGLQAGKPLDWSPLGEVPTASQLRAAAVVPPPPAPAQLPRAPVTAPVVEKDSGEPSTRLLLVGFAGVLLMTLVAGLVAMALLRTPPEMMVPNVLGKPRSIAASTLKNAGLEAEVRENYSDSVQIGLVYLQEPGADRAVKQGSVVRLFVSKGPQPVLVPDVVGRPAKAAQAAIREAQLLPGALKEEFSDSVPKGEVITQEPSPGAPVTKRSSVGITVSKGPEPIPEPKTVEVDSVPDEGVTPTEPSEEAPERQFQVTVRVPPQPQESQNVKIIVQDEDGNEHEEYNADHDPGEEIQPVVRGVGHSGKIVVRVLVNGQQRHRQRF